MLLLAYLYLKTLSICIGLLPLCSLFTVCFLVSSVLHWSLYHTVRNPARSRPASDNISWLMHAEQMVPSKNTYEKQRLIADSLVFVCSCSWKSMLFTMYRWIQRLYGPVEYPCGQYRFFAPYRHDLSFLFRATVNSIPSNRVQLLSCHVAYMAVRHVAIDRVD